MPSSCFYLVLLSPSDPMNCSNKCITRVQHTVLYYLSLLAPIFVLLRLTPTDNCVYTATVRHTTVSHCMQRKYNTSFSLASKTNMYPLRRDWRRRCKPKVLWVPLYQGARAVVTAALPSVCSLSSGSGKCCCFVCSLFLFLFLEISRSSLYREALVRRSPRKIKCVFVTLSPPNRRIVFL